jgi:hypothetical protein
LPYSIPRKFGLLYSSLVLLLISLLTGNFESVFADPGAAGFALGGLQFKKESRISMVKENLTIAADWGDGPSLESTITADYEFLNRTDQDVAIRIAFPVPDEICWAAASPYMIFTEDWGGQPRTPFHVWVEGREIKYSTEARAFRTNWDAASSNRGQDYTKLLHRMGVAGPGCPRSADFSVPDKQVLISLGLLREAEYANWTWQVKYYWMQKFPAKKITHVKISYPAMVGERKVYVGDGPEETYAFWHSELRHTCGGPELARGVRAEMSRPDDYISLAWVDFILVTANYWSGPIEDFTLTVQVPGFIDHAAHVNFCWGSRTKRVDSTHIVAAAHNFSPTRDLHIGFFQVVD